MGSIYLATHAAPIGHNKDAYFLTIYSNVKLSQTVVEEKISP